MRLLADVSIRRPVFATMLILALVVVGAASYMELGVDRFPAVDLPTVLVRTNLPGAAPEDVESEVSVIIEEVVNTVEGVRELRSISASGASFVIATFDLERDIDVAAQDVRDRVQSVLRRLPAGVDPPVVSKQDNDASPVLTIALSADRSVRELTELADKLVKVQLERGTGVGEVRVVGGLERAVNVWIDADRLAAYGLPITAVRDAIAEQNANVPGGNVTTERTEQPLRTMGRLTDARGFDDLVVATRNRVPVRVRDLGYAEDGTREARSIAHLDGKPTVIVEVRRQSGANTVAVIEGAKENLERVRAQLPPDVRVELTRDQSEYIYAALREINSHLIAGSVLASLLVLAFMGSWRSTVIAAVAIPTSVIATFGMMAALDFTLNSVTMLALVLMVGVVIDDAIVVLENIFRFVEEKGLSPFEAARQGTAEIALAVMATTLSLVVIFVPVSFMSSISGRFLYQFGITSAVAVLVSLLVSFTLTPMMSARLLRPGTASPSGDHAASRGGFYAWLDRAYAWVLALALRYRVVVLLIAAAVVASSVPLYGMVRTEYVPSDVDESAFEVRVQGPLGMSVAALDTVMLQIDQDIRSIRGVEAVLVQAGGGFLGGAATGDAFVRLIPHEKRTFSLGRLWAATLAGEPRRAFEGNYTQRDVMVELRRRLRKYRDLRCSVRNFASFNIGGGNFDIDFSIRGPELEALARYADELRERVLKLGGIVDPDTTLKLAQPELRAIIDRDRAADLGVRTRDVATALRIMVGGDEEVSRFRDPTTDESYDVQLRLVAQDRDQAATIERLFVPRTVPRPGGAAALAEDEIGAAANLVRLDSVVRLEAAQSASRIDRLDRQRMASLRAGVGPGYALADRLEAIQGAVDEMQLPPAYSTAVMGRGRELARTYKELIWAFTLSIIFMYMVLASQFESLIHPFTILLSLPLSVPFALLSLWASGNTLNLFSALGMLVLFGVVKKNSILQVDHMNALRAAGLPREEAILRGNRDRLRPILMTTLTLVAGMLPLWVGTGPGAEERRAVAVVVIGGQSLSLLLTLLVTPVVYTILDDLAGWRRRRAG